MTGLVNVGWNKPNKSSILKDFVKSIKTFIKNLEEKVIKKNKAV